MEIKSAEDWITNFTRVVLIDASAGNQVTVGCRWNRGGGGGDSEGIQYSRSLAIKEKRNSELQLERSMGVYGGLFQRLSFCLGHETPKSVFSGWWESPREERFKTQDLTLWPSEVRGWSQDPEPLRVDLLPPRKPEDKTQTQGLSSRPGSRTTPGSRKWGLEWQDWPVLTSEGLLIVVSDK